MIELFFEVSGWTISRKRRKSSDYLALPLNCFGSWFITNHRNTSSSKQVILLVTLWACEVVSSVALGSILGHLVSWPKGPRKLHSRVWPLGACHPDLSPSPVVTCGWRPQWTRKVLGLLQGWPQLPHLLLSHSVDQGKSQGQRGFKGHAEIDSTSFFF